MDIYQNNNPSPKNLNGFTKVPSPSNNAVYSSLNDKLNGVPKLKFFESVQNPIKTISVSVAKLSEPETNHTPTTSAQQSGSSQVNNNSHNEAGFSLLNGSNKSNYPALSSATNGPINGHYDQHSSNAHQIPSPTNQFTHFYNNSKLNPPPPQKLIEIEPISHQINIKNLNYEENESSQKVNTQQSLLNDAKEDIQELEKIAQKSTQNLYSPPVQRKTEFKIPVISIVLNENVERDFQTSPIHKLHIRNSSLNTEETRHYTDNFPNEGNSLSRIQSDQSFSGLSKHQPSGQKEIEIKNLLNQKITNRDQQKLSWQSPKMFETLSNLQQENSISLESVMESDEKPSANKNHIFGDEKNQKQTEPSPENFSQFGTRKLRINTESTQYTTNESIQTKFTNFSPNFSVQNFSFEPSEELRKRDYYTPSFNSKTDFEIIQESNQEDIKENKKSQANLPQDQQQSNNYENRSIINRYEDLNAATDQNQINKNYETYKFSEKNDKLLYATQLGKNLDSPKYRSTKFAIPNGVIYKPTSIQSQNTNLDSEGQNGNSSWNNFYKPTNQTFLNSPKNSTNGTNFFQQINYNNNQNNNSNNSITNNPNTHHYLNQKKIEEKSFYQYNSLRNDFSVENLQNTNFIEENLSNRKSNDHSTAKPSKYYELDINNNNNNHHHNHIHHELEPSTLTNSRNNYREIVPRINLDQQNFMFQQFLINPNELQNSQSSTIEIVSDRQIYTYEYPQIQYQDEQTYYSPRLQHINPISTATPNQPRYVYSNLNQPNVTINLNQDFNSGPKQYLQIAKQSPRNFDNHFKQIY